MDLLLGTNNETFMGSSCELLAVDSLAEKFLKAIFA